MKIFPLQYFARTSCRARALKLQVERFSQYDYCILCSTKGLSLQYLTRRNLHRAKCFENGKLNVSTNYYVAQRSLDFFCPKPLMSQFVRWLIPPVVRVKGVTEKDLEKWKAQVNQFEWFQGTWEGVSRWTCARDWVCIAEQMFNGRVRILEKCVRGSEKFFIGWISSKWELIY